MRACTSQVASSYCKSLTGKVQAVYKLYIIWKSDPKMPRQGSTLAGSDSAWLVDAPHKRSSNEGLNEATNSTKSPTYVGFKYNVDLRFIKLP